MKISERDIVESVGYNTAESISFGTVISILDDDVTDWGRQVERALRLPRIAHLEIWLEYLPTMHQARDLAEMMSGVSRTIHGPFGDVNLSSPWREHGDISERRVCRSAEVADLLGAAIMTLHAGKYPTYESHTAAVGRLARRLSRISAGCDVGIGIENLKAKRSGVSREAIATAGDIDVLLEIYPEAKLTLDVGHAFQSSENPIEMLERFSDRVASVHIHDVGVDGRSHHELGTGLVDIKGFAGALIRHTPEFVTLETLGEAETERSWSRLQEDVATTARDLAS